MFTCNTWLNELYKGDVVMGMGIVPEETVVMMIGFLMVLVVAIRI